MGLGNRNGMGMGILTAEPGNGNEPLGIGVNGNKNVIHAHLYCIGLLFTKNLIQHLSGVGIHACFSHDFPVHHQHVSFSLEKYDMVTLA